MENAIFSIFSNEKRLLQNENHCTMKYSWGEQRQNQTKKRNAFYTWTTKQTVAFYESSMNLTRDFIAGHWIKHSKCIHYCYNGYLPEKSLHFPLTTKKQQKKRNGN